MPRAARLAVALWLLSLAACLAVVLRSEFTADMSAFLPRDPSPEQQLLVEQLKEGSLSRLLLVGIEGGDGPGRARLSRALAAAMAAGGDFVAVQNGEAAALAKDREILFGHRYLLSPAVDAERFTVAGLRAAIAESIDLLASPAGLLVKGLLPRDPTGELFALFGSLAGGGGPASRHGVWTSADGRRALLMAQTAAAGSDTDAQEAALARLRAGFADLARGAGVADARLLLSGTPVFAVHSRATIRDEVERLALVGTGGVLLLLLLVYRSPRTVVLGLLPVASGALAGVAAVSLGFGSVHGITIGFGTTLIGEAVDYSIYYFVQSRAGEPPEAWRARFWPTIRLGLFTSLCGFAVLLLSGFPGLAQLGLYSSAGLLAAAAVTRYVLPHLRPAGFRLADLRSLGEWLVRVVAGLAGLRWTVWLLAGLALVVLAGQRERLWQAGLGDLSPLPAAQMALDAELRADLGAGDQRYLLVATAADREAALQAAERLAGQLRPLVERGELAGFSSPSDFLPSEATQRRRQAALPAPAELAGRLPQAVAGLPLRAERLQPFLADVAAAAGQPLLDRAALAGSSLALAVDALLLRRPAGWTVLLPLQAPRAGAHPHEIDRAALAAAIAAAGVAGARFVDLGGESHRLYAGYLREAILLSLGGFAAIVALLAATLRSPQRLARVLAPLVAAVLVVMAGLLLAGVKLTLLHLVGLLLIVAVGSNYALFFDGVAATGEAAQTLASLLVANATTVVGFGVLAFSPVPVLQAIGATVGPGAVLALLFAAVLGAREVRR